MAGNLLPRFGNDPVADALVSEHLSKLKGEVAPDDRQSPLWSNREELLALSYKLGLQELRPEERREKALALVRGEISGQEELYARLSHGNPNTSPKPRFVLAVGGALIGLLTGFTVLFFTECRGAEPQTQAALTAPIPQMSPAFLAAVVSTPAVCNVRALNEPHPFEERKDATLTYVHELQEWSRMRKVHMGNPDDLSALIAMLSEPDLSEDVGSLIRSIMYRENLKISSSALLDLLSLAWTERAFSEANITVHEKKTLITFVDKAMKPHRLAADDSLQ